MQSRQIDLTINKMTKAQYNAITPNADEIYLITDDNGLTQSDITTALGYTPVNPTSLATVATTGSYNDLADKPYIPSGVIVDQTYNPSSANAQSGVAINGAGFLTSITSSDVTTALGYTPYNSSNPNGYTSNVGTVTSVNNVQPVNGNVTIAIPTVPTNISAFNNDSGYITGITSSDVTTALGYTPYNSSNPSGYITSSDLPTNHVTTDTDQNITGVKTFVGQKKIAFKQSSSSDKLGFTLYNNSGTEKGYLEYNPSNTVDSVPLMTLGNYATASAGLAHVGFRKYSNISGANGAYNLLAPLISDAKTPFSLTTTYTNFYMPLGFTDGNSTVKTAKSGLVDLSSILPTVNNSTITFTQGGVTKGTITLNQSSNGTIALDAGGSGGIQNTATGTDSLTILGTPASDDNSINIGVGSQTSDDGSIAIGAGDSSNQFNGAIAIERAIAIGSGYDGYNGASADGYSVAIGTETEAIGGAIAIGSSAKATATGGQSIAIGYVATASGASSIALGNNAESTASNAIQIGFGTNNNANTLQVGSRQLLNLTTGLIPDDRLSSNIARTSQITTPTYDSTNERITW